jgi:hypothetical protein
MMNNGLPLVGGLGPCLYAHSNERRLLDQIDLNEWFRLIVKGGRTLIHKVEPDWPPSLGGRPRGVGAHPTLLASGSLPLGGASGVF